MCSYNYYLQFSDSKCLPSLLVITSLLRITFAALQKPCQGNFRMLQGSDEARFGGSEKDRYFLKFPKWQHKLVRNYKWGKLVSYFLNNAAKTWLYGLKISENIETEHVFRSKAFFHLTSNLHTSCFSTCKRSSLPRPECCTWFLNYYLQKIIRRFIMQLVSLCTSKHPLGLNQKFSSSYAIPCSISFLL